MITLETVLTAETIALIVEIVQQCFEEYEENKEAVDLTTIEENSTTIAENTTAIKEQLVITDTRLDTEFKALNESLSFCEGALCVLVAWNVLRLIFGGFTK